jgi:two-component system, LytTR family, response regulator
MKDELKQKIETHSYNLNKQGGNKKIVLKTLESIHIIEIKDIIRCESDGNYTTFYINNKEKIMVSHQLKEYEDILKEYNFFRTHQSHLINLDYVLKYEKQDGGYVVMKDESIITVAQRKKDLFLKIINNL